MQEEKPTESSFSNDSDTSSPATVIHKPIVLNGDDVERRLRDLVVVEHDYDKDLEKKVELGRFR